MSAPRVLLGFDYFARYTIGLASGIRACGWQTALAYHVHDHAFGLEPGALERYVGERVAGDVPLMRVPGRIRDPRQLRAAGRSARAVRRWAPDVLHVQTCVSNDPRLLLALGLRRGAYAITVHDVETHPGDAASPWHQERLVRGLIHGAGLVFVHAEPLREALLRDGLEVPTVVVPHGTEPAELGPLPQKPQLLLFGRLSRYKGVDVLLDAMPRVWDRRPEVELTIAGEGELPAHPVLDDARVRVVHRHVPEAEVPELFRAASLVMLPYVEASQSGVGSLAKGFGRPLLASAVGGLAELVADGSGELVPAGDAAALAERTVSLVSDRARLEQLAAAGARSAAAAAGWTGVAQQTIAAYRRHLPNASR